MNIQLEKRLMQIDARNEKLPLTCFLCGMIDHVEDQCECYKGHQLNDKAKPFGRWFQMDMFDKDYRQSVGKHFGLDMEGGWVMKAPPAEEVDELMDEERVNWWRQRHGG